MTARQSEWDAEDRAIISALQDLKADSCPGCGLPLSESLHITGRDEKRYDANFVVCDGCLAREEKQHIWAARDQQINGFDPSVGARHWVVNRYEKKG